MTMFVNFHWQQRIGHNTGKVITRHGEHQKGTKANAKDIKSLLNRKKSDIY